MSALGHTDCVASIVDCIRKMRAEGLADNEIADLFRHAADELDEATMSKDGEVDPAAERYVIAGHEPRVCPRVCRRSRLARRQRKKRLGFPHLCG